MRESFFDEVRDDPYAHMVTQIAAQFWAEGYEQALREHGLNEERLRKSFSDRVREAHRYISDSKREAEAKMIVAMAQLAANGAQREPGLLR